MCGLFSTQITINTGVLCGGYICNDITAIGEEKTSLYRGFIECSENCTEHYRDCKITQSTVSTTTICDGKCDDPTKCQDEEGCGGFRYGVRCTTNSGFVHRSTPIWWICDGKDQRCKDKPDEQNCDVTENTSHTCDHYFAKAIYNKNLTVPILNYTRCSLVDFLTSNSFNEYPYCWNYLDQTNCSDPKRIGGQCPVNGFMSNISKYIICDSVFKKTADLIHLCDDGLENSCISPLSSKSCRVHKHKMCNKVNDCFDKSDEYHDDCLSLTRDFRCERSFYTNGSVQFPLSWVLDNATDCMNGEDENMTIWSFCGTNSGTRRVKLLNEPCEDVYRCVGGSKNYVRFENLCDGVESCGMENKVCWLARDFPTINSTATINGTVLDLCQSQHLSEGKSCSEKEVKTKIATVFGVANTFRIKIKLPDSKVNCSRTFGEYYVYLSCMAMCLEVNATCPLNNKALLHDSCPGQYPDRVYTVAKMMTNDSYLTFARELDNGYYHPKLYQCNNSKCIEYRQVCNLIDDCGDASDEVNCINNLICKDTVNKSKNHLISIEQQCDGIYDCFDFSDECNDMCGRKILESFTLKCLGWFLGISAVLLNTVTVVRGVCTLTKSETEGLLIYNTLVSVIGFGDLLVGIYLISLSVYDSIIFGRDFCRHQAEWLTGSACSVLGVISTVGSQMSLFAMSALSMARVTGIAHKMMAPIAVSRSSAFKAINSAIAVATFSLAIAFIPLIPSLEDYFVQGMYYDPNYKVFIGFPDKARHLRILEAYFNSTIDKNISKTITTDMTWQDIGNLVDNMFTKDYGSLTRTPVQFYGNDGVCLFRYFVRSDDARRSRQTSQNMTDITDHKGDLIVWLMMGINLFCVVLIASCYMLINIVVKKSSQELAVQNANDSNSAKQKSEILQKRIAIIIASDFLCWAPFITVSALHNLKYIDATDWYVAFALTTLPINSVVNPIIYNIELVKSVFAFDRSSMANIMESFFRQICAEEEEEEEEKQDEETEMEATRRQSSMIGQPSSSFNE